MFNAKPTGTLLSQRKTESERGAGERGRGGGGGGGREQPNCFDTCRLHRREAERGREERIMTDKCHQNMSQSQNKSQEIVAEKRILAERKMKNRG